MMHICHCGEFVLLATTVNAHVHPCAKVMALFLKCENFQTLTFSNFLENLAFQLEMLVSIYVKFH